MRRFDCRCYRRACCSTTWRQSSKDCIHEWTTTSSTSSITTTHRRLSLGYFFLRPSSDKCSVMRFSVCIRNNRIGQTVRRLPDPVLGAGAVHRRMGTVHGELLLGGEHVLPAAHQRLSARVRRAQVSSPHWVSNRCLSAHFQGSTDLLLPMGAFCAGARSAHVLYSVHHVARTAPLAFRYEPLLLFCCLSVRASPSSDLPSSSLRSDACVLERSIDQCRSYSAY